MSELHPGLVGEAHAVVGEADLASAIGSGRLEVYVRPYPKTNGRRWQVSTGGGKQLR